MMRYPVGLVCLLAGLVALPLSVSAQVGEEGTTSEENLQESAASSEPAHEQGALSPGLRKRTRKKWDPQTYDVPASRPSPEEPALQLKLDDAGVQLVSPPPRTPDGYTLEEMDRRVERAKIGLGVSAGLVLVGVALVLAPAFKCFLGEWTESCNRLENAGIAVMVGGGLGMIASGGLLGARKRKLRELRQAHYGTPRRVQWDLARSRVVF